MPDGRLGPVELQDSPSGTTYLCAADGKWLHIRLPAAQVTSYLELIDRETDLDEGAAAQGLDGGTARRIAALLADRGSLAVSGSAIRWRMRLIGDESLCRRAAPFPEPPDANARTLLVLLQDGYGEERVATARDALRPGEALVVVTVAENRIAYGPVVTTRNAAALTAARLRRLTTATFPGAVPGPTPIRSGRWPTDSQLSWALATMAADLDGWDPGPEDLGTEHEVVLDPRTLTVRRHRVLPLPFDGDGHDYPITAATVEELIDERLGVVTRVERVRHHDSLPSSLISVRARVANMNRVSPWMTDPMTGGQSFTSYEAAAGAAVGEACERYSGEIVQTERVRIASYHELAAGDEYAVDPETLVLFSDRQYAQPGFPFVPFTRDLKAGWMCGRSLTRDVPAWLPASLIYPNWYTGGYEDLPHTNNPFYPGIAAGPDLSSAIAAGIQEIIERHATMIWWANAHPLPVVRPTAELDALWRDADPAQQRWLVHLDNEFGVPVFAGFLHKPDEQLFTVGFAARPDPAQAAMKAWAEAVTLQDQCRDLQRADGDYWAAAARGDVNGEFMKKWRADRRYLDDYREDFRDVISLRCQLQVNLDPRAVRRVLPWVRPDDAIDMGDVPALPGRPYETLREVVEQRGYEIFYVDITTRDVAATGMRVVRVLIPGLVPNYAAGLPFLGRGVVRDKAVEYGWRDTPAAESELNHFPMAHS